MPHAHLYKMHYMLTRTEERCEIRPIAKKNDTNINSEFKYYCHQYSMIEHKAVLVITKKIRNKVYWNKIINIHCTRFLGTSRNEEVKED